MATRMMSGRFSIIAVCLQLIALQQTIASHIPSVQVHKRAPSSNLGLSVNNLDKNGISVGFLPAWGEEIEANNCTVINQLIPKPMAIAGVYVQLSADDPDLSQLDYYMTDIYNQPGDLPVLNLALMPTEGLGNVTLDMANTVAAKMAAINAKGVPVWLRYAHEMNGDWYSYGQQPEAFLESWTMVANAVHAATNDTCKLFLTRYLCNPTHTDTETDMYWSPNSMFASDYNYSNYVGGYTPYWPAPETVDLVGLSFYTYGTWNRLNIMPPNNSVLDTIGTFDQMFGTGQNKPLALAETGASFTYMTDWQVGEGNATEAEIKFNWLWQLLSPETAEAIPSLKAITWFEVIKEESAGVGADMKIEDFRLVTGKEYVQSGAVGFFQQASSVTTSESAASATAGTLAVSSGGTTFFRPSFSTFALLLLLTLATSAYHHFE